MTHEELQAIIKTAVDAAIAPLAEVQRKYDNITIINQPQAPERKLAPGQAFARLVKGIARAKMDEKDGAGIAGSTLEKAAFFLEKMYATDSEFIKNVKALSAGGDGGYLIQEQYSDEIIPLLYAKAVITLLGARTVPMPKGNLNMPKLVSGVAAQYIGENMGQKAQQAKFGNVKFSAKKLRATSPISNDLLKSNSYSSDMFVLNDIITSMKLAMDYHAFYGSGSEFAPRGVVNLKEVDSSSVNALPDSDVTAALKGALIDKNIPMVSPGWAFNGTMYSILYNLKDGSGNYIHRAEMNTGKFQGFPFQLNTQIPTGADAHGISEIFFGDWNEFMIGEQTGIEVVASTEATYTDDTGNQVSAFDLDQTVIRSIMLHDMQPAHGKAFIVRKFYTK
jgi:HK97 family phage major capsid protein